MAAPFGAFGLLDHLVASTHTVGEGLYTLQVFFRLVSTKIKLEFVNLPDGDWVWIVNDPPVPTDVISDQWTLALLVQRFKRLAAKFKVQQAYLSEPASAPERIYEEHFGVPVQRGQPQAGMKLASGSWRARISTADPTLHRTLRSLAERVEVKAFHKAPLAYALQMRLPDALRSGRYSTQQMAAQLGLSPRTFQRRLNEEQVTFTQVLDAYRQDEALKLLEQGDKSMAEIAYALGYNEQSSFNRAFKRWTGKTPKMWAKETERT
jgi:AraC-like DNA-binding protein